jgi:hypothetical protein
MRTTLTFPVHALVLSLVGTGLWCESSRAQETPPRYGFFSSHRARGTESESAQEIATVDSWGENQGEAKAYAIKKALPLVEHYLRSQVPGLEWQPPRAYIERAFFQKKPERVESKDVEDGDGRMKCWRWTVAIRRSTWQDILRRDAEQRVAHRMGFLGLILAAVLAFLAVVAGYIRLDDWTKGYYTGWLLTGAVSGLALAGAVAVYALRHLS